MDCSTRSSGDGAGSFFDYLVCGPYAHHFQRTRRVGTRGAHLLWFDQPAGRHPDPAGHDIVLGFMTCYDGQRPGRFDLSAGAFHARPTPGSFVVVPPGADADYELPAPMAGVVLTIPPSAFQHELHDALGGRSPDFGSVHGSHQYDTAVVAAIRALTEVSNGGVLDEALFGDTVVAFILASLVRMKGQHPSVLPGGLSPARLARVVDYVHAHLDQTLSLSDLADQACLSSYHFARSFKATTGRSPAAYVHAVRVQRARELLAFTVLNLAEIALSCGFASQAHFTTAFRRRLGVTPGAYRDGLHRRPAARVAESAFGVAAGGRGLGLLPSGAARIPVEALRV
jgi:AraC family transcriptional regulator